jgi:hypothetical protein
MTWLTLTDKQRERVRGLAMAVLTETPLTSSVIAGRIADTPEHAGGALRELVASGRAESIVDVTGREFYRLIAPVVARSDTDDQRVALEYVPQVRS